MYQLGFPGTRTLVPLIAAILIGTIPGEALAGGKLGLQVMANRTQLSGELPDEGSWKPSLGLSGGLVAEVDFAPTLSLSFQPTLTRRGSQQEFKVLGQVVKYVDYDFDYLSLPLIVRVTGASEGVRGFVTAGLDVGILIEASSTTTNAVSGMESSPEDITNTLNSSSLGALFGAGVMVPLSRNYMTFELRYFQGLDDIVARENSDAESVFSSPSVKYRGLELIVGFLFGLGGK
jgi:hypothetical protein